MSAYIRKEGQSKANTNVASYFRKIHSHKPIHPAWVFGSTVTSPNESRRRNLGFDFKRRLRLNLIFGREILLQKDYFSIPEIYEIYCMDTNKAPKRLTGLFMYSFRLWYFRAMNIARNKSTGSSLRNILGRASETEEKERRWRGVCEGRFDRKHGCHVRQIRYQGYRSCTWHELLPNFECISKNRSNWRPIYYPTLSEPLSFHYFNRAVAQVGICLLIHCATCHISVQINR